MVPVEGERGVVGWRERVWRGVSIVEEGYGEEEVEEEGML
jgi:hypothetical protein